MSALAAVDDCSRVYRWQAQLSRSLDTEGLYSVHVLLDGIDLGDCTIEMKNGQWAVPARGVNGACAYTVDVTAVAATESASGGATPSDFRLTGVSGQVGDAAAPGRIRVGVSLDGVGLVDDETELTRHCGEVRGTVG